LCFGLLGPDHGIIQIGFERLDFAVGGLDLVKQDEILRLQLKGE
jgi:hypothetical protein